MKNIYIKYSFLVLLLFLSPAFLMAQEAGVSSAAEKGAFDWAFENIILLLGAATAFGAFWSVLYLNNKILQVQKIQLLKEHGIEVMEEVKLIDKDPWWKRLYDKSWDLVPVEKEKDILLDHNYDGIRELDNVLPPWWVAMFWGCVFFGLGYLAYFHVWDMGLSSTEAYAAEVEYAEERVAAFLAKQANNVDESNVAMVEDEAKLNLGEAVYMANCATCHGQKGEGGIGPNMTDNYWIHGGNITDVFKTIKYGVPAKGMIAWKAQLRPSDIQNVASYILKMQGPNPPNAKGPQGELYESEVPTTNENEEKSIGMK